MAVGESATAAGFPLVPDSGEDGRVRWGGREINRTRDLIALVKQLIPVSKSAWRDSAGVSSGATVPANTVGDNGDVFFKVV